MDRSSEGVYLLANDRVIDHAIALAASIRAVDSEIPIVMIPYEESSGRAAALLREHFGVRPFPAPDKLERLVATVDEIFGPGFFRRPGNLRKQVAWSGPFERFLYLDADVVVFRGFADLLRRLDRYDFVCCDDQHEGGLAHVFTPRIVEDGVLDIGVTADVFNGGVWAANRDLVSEDSLYAAFEDCARHPEWLDFSRGGSDQPILNYLVLTRIPRRLNIYREGDAEPRMWAGTRGFRRRGHQLLDPRVAKPLRFLHWAGVGIGPGYPYWRTWKHFRFLNAGIPVRPDLPTPPRSPWQRTAAWLRQGIAGVRGRLRSSRGVVDGGLPC